MDFRGKHIVVVGAGLSGLALCRLLCRRGATVTLSDRQSRAALAGLDELADLPVRLDLGCHTEALFTSADLIVLSPGVPATIPPVAAAQQQGVPVIGEIELAAGELEAPMIGITGTNGKSTTTALLGAILRACGKQTFVGGNIGEPLTNAIDAGGLDWLVVELSSFQLETIARLHPRYAMLLNLSDDHLDRYAGMEEYRSAKMRLFENMTADDHAILNADDPQVVALADSIKAEKLWFSTRKADGDGMRLLAGEIVWRRQGSEARFPIAELQLKGLHNVENVMAAMIPALCEGCAPQQVWQAVCAFRGLPHRMELVRQLDGVDWYNDSKGTNIGSVVMSLAGLVAPVTLIAGGKDKGGELAILNEAMRSKVAKLILIGEAAPRMAQAYFGLTDIVRADSLEQAVALAQELTPAGGSVLLSPGCSSFDMFKSYAERGEVFRRLVMALKVREAI